MSRNTTTVNLHQCRLCGSIVSCNDGVERHKKVCNFANKGLKGKIEQMVTVNFPCPIVALKRIHLTPQQASSLKKQTRYSSPVSKKNNDNANPSILYPTPPPRKSSLRALEMFHRLSSNDDDGAEAHSDSVENEDNDDVIPLEWESADAANDNDFDDDLQIKSASVSKQHGPRRERKPREIGKSHFGFHCSQCPARFNYENQLKTHEDCVHGEGSKGRTIFTCPVCARMFHTRLIFQCHMKNHENAEALEAAFDLWNKWPPPTLGKAFSCSCKYCVIPLKNHEMFLTHMKTDHKDKSRDMTYSCTYCASPEGHNFESMKLLFQHIQTCHSMEYYGTQERNPGGSVKCKLCKKVMTYFYYKHHMKRRHSNHSSDHNGTVANVNESNSLISCPLKGCVGKFTALSRLKSHFIIIHLKNNPYACPIPGCKTRCDAACHLRRHLALHSGKGFKCEKCELVFSRKDKLRGHKCKEALQKRKLTNYYDKNGLLRSHYSHLRVKRLPGSTYDDDSNDTEEDSMRKKIEKAHELQVNQNIDINELIEADPVFIKACKENPGFRDMIIPKVRGRKRKTGDSGSNQFKCMNCDSTFDSMGRLKQHETKMHTHRPYKCGKCEQRFTKRSFLESHMKFHETKTTANDFYRKLGCGNFQCSKCEIQSAYEVSIRRHLRTKHNINIPSRKSARKSAKASLAKSGSKRKSSMKPHKSLDSELDWEPRDESVVVVKTEEPVAHFSIVKIEHESPKQPAGVGESSDLDLETSVNIKAEHGNEIADEVHDDSNFNPVILNVAASAVDTNFAGAEEMDHDNEP